MSRKRLIIFFCVLLALLVLPMALPYLLGNIVLPWWAYVFYAGIILVKNNNTVAGLTTAAGMWVTATIGLAFGYGFYGGGVLATIICMINAALLTKFEHRHLQAIRYYAEVNDIEKIQDILDQIEAALQKDVFIETVPAKSGLAGRIGFEITTTNNNNREEIKQALTRIEGIDFVVPG